ncbi:hypothetical protein HBN50_04915 [Halobacteriovorax sp. GB3]|uniref:tetratricopeptide repeat protein n=1 Tax=Halobacteriovorax sp. GB3 TaxID=2719615 RepID=UPI00235EECAF|nr:hypothetical protein [Halobacteriovorax sp. GB3]MDD0852425.1 hypothetical protein [Halobacteriovorax sp. GB3]
MSKLKKVLVLFLLISNLQAYADVNSRRQELMSIIDEELREIVRLNKQSNGGRPSLMIRMAELWLEKARITREAENKKFLQIPPRKRMNINKGKFFGESRKYFKQAEKTSVSILNKFRNFSGKGDVYYILAYNAKEFNQDAKALRYFQLAVQNSNLNSMTSVKSHLALAEIYYNKQQYSKARPLYEKALSKKSLRDKWWTKDAYNLAWCYYRLNLKSKAIDLMKDVERMSSNSKYIDMSNQASRDLAIFYAESGSVKTAVSSFKKTGGDVAKKLLSLGNYLESKAKYDSAEGIYRDALRNNPDTYTKNEIYSKQLSIYERFGKQDLHIAVIEKMTDSFKKGELNKDQKEILEYHVKRSGAILQKQVVGNLYERRPKERRRRADLVVRYFSTYALIVPKMAAQAYYLSGETMYAIKDFDSAIKYYELAKNEAEKSGNRKIERKSTEGMIAALGSEGVSKKTKDLYMAKALESFLKENPRGKKSLDVYQKLFALYIDAKDVAKAESILIRFRKFFPQQSQKQEAMLAEIMDFYKDKKDRAGISKWVALIKNGTFRVSPKYAKQVNLLLLTMQFEGVKNAQSKGDKVKALRIYFEVYKSKESSPEARKKAAYNMAVYFYELGDAERSYKWMERAISHMTNKDVKTYEDSILVTSRDLFNQRRVAYAAEIAEKAFEKLCRQRSKNKDLFVKNAVIMNLAEKNIKKAEALVYQAASCGVSKKKVNDLKVEMLNAFYEEKRWSKYSSLIAELDKVDYLRPLVAAHYVKLYDVYKDSGRASNAADTRRKLIRNYTTSRRKDEYPVEALDVIALYKLEGLESLYRQFERTNLQFPEKTYNNLLKKKFSMINNLTDRTVEIFKLRSGKGMVAAYRLLVNSYEKFGEEIREFTPPGKSPEYVKSFKGSMAQIANPILQKASSLRDEAKKNIFQYNILSRDNGFFLNSGLDNVTEFIPLKDPVIMDRGGRR